MSLREALAFTASAGGTIDFAGGIGGGTINLGSDAAVAANTTFNIANFNTVGGPVTLTIAGNHLAIASGFTINTETSHIMAISSALTGSGALTNSGAGTLTWSANNDYSGSTTVAAGSLLVTGALSATSDITVASGAMLSTEISGTTVGSGYHQVIVNGAVTLSGATLALDLGGFTPALGDSFTLIDNDNPDAILGNFATVTLGGSPVSVVGNRFVSDGKSYLISYDGGTGNDLVLSVFNNAPVPDVNASPSLPAVAEDVLIASNTGASIANLVVDGSITDVEGTAEAVAVTAVDNTHGSWQYSLDNGTTWTNFSNTTGQLMDLSLTSRLLDGALTGGDTNKIRFLPNSNYNGTSTFTFRAWDKITGTTGNTADTTTNGGNTAISADTDTAAIAVTPVNDAPTLVAGGGVETTGLGSATGLEGASSVFDPVVATGSNGDHYVVAWTDMPTTTTVAAKAQVFDSSGVALTSVITVTTTALPFSTTLPIKIDVDMDASGRFAVLYDNVPATSGLADMAFQRYNANGTTFSTKVAMGTTNRVDSTGSIDLSDSGRI